MEETKEQRAIEDLMAKNRAMFEELTQCQADKEFVWNLWRRLQSSQPEVTSVVSMVIAREKEKSEVKDKKILEILKLKDEKIKELKERILSAGEETQYSKERYHDLLIENEELKQQVDLRQSEFTAKEKEMSEEKSYLSSLLNAHQAQKEIEEQKIEKIREQLEEEKSELQTQIVHLERNVDELNEDKLNMATAIEANSVLEEKIRSLECEVEDLTEKSTEVANKYDEVGSKLHEKEKLVEEQLSSLQEQSERISQRENEVMNLNIELEQLRESYRLATVQLSEQARVTQQLQTLQNDNHRVSVHREQRFRKEVASLQKSVADLQVRCSLFQEKENKLQQDIKKLKENSRGLKEELSVKEIVIKELKDAVRDGIQSGRDGTGVSGREGTGVSGRDGTRVSGRDGRLDEEAAGERSFSQGEERTRAESNRTRAVHDQHTDRQQARVLSNGGEPESKAQLNKKIGGSGLGTAANQELREGRLEEVEVLRELETTLSQSRKTIDELKKLLELKDDELVETRRAHSQRQQRYRMLKENYQLVLEQLKTYEISGAEERERPPLERAEERDLRHLDSDQVWKELAYYKNEYEVLAKERHDVLEEIDVLRVQHANNVANIQELRVHLSEEKEETAELRFKIGVEREAVDVARREVETLDDQVQGWQDKALQGQTIANEFEEENQLLKQEIKALQGQNKKLSNEFSKLAEEFESLKQRVDEEKDREREKVKMESERVQEKELTVQVRKDNAGEELTKQQVESLSSYDAQVRRIANRILTSPTKETEESLRNVRATQGTQTDEAPRFGDSGINVNLDSENISLDEEALDLTSVKKNKPSKGGDVGRKIPQTPQARRVLRKTPGRNEWTSMRQRILSLTQEVSALRQSKDKAVKAVSQHKENCDSLQGEYNVLLQKLQVSRNSVQRLTEALKESQKEKDLMMVQLNERRELQPSVLSITEWKHLEDQLRMATSECMRLSSIVRTLGNENEQLRIRFKETQENIARLEHVISQKKILVDEVKAKMKTVEEKSKKDSEAAKNSEEKLSQLKEREKINKVRVETLERRLESETREKQEYHQQVLNCQDELKKKSQQLARSQTLRNQAKIVVSEMEAAATTQLQGLANQSEATMTSLHRKFEQAQERIEEFQAFVRTLVEELVLSMRTLRVKLEELQEKQWKEASKVAVKQAQTKACSILNISSSDLEDIMQGREARSEEVRLRTQQEKAWMAEIESSLKRQGSFAVPLLECVLDLIDERVTVEVKFAAL